MKPIRRTRSDTSQKTILEALDEAGYEYWVIGWPDDILVRKHSWRPNWFRMLSVKTPDAKGRIRIRKDQDEQNKFCLTHGVPRVGTPEQALEAFRE